MNELVKLVSDLEKYQQELEKRACERSLEAFTKAAWHIIEPGTELIWNWHLSTICGYLEAFHYGKINRRLIINVPPGTLKSILVSVMYPAWVWVNAPEKRFLTIANEQGLAIRDAIRMKQIITSNWFQSKWSLSLQSDQNEKTLYANEKKGFRQSQGITASNTGKRGDCLLSGSMVATEIGDIDIADLVKMNANSRPRVYSFNHHTGEVELKKIVSVKQSVSNKLVKVSSLSCDIICTENHRIFTGYEYEKAKNITGSTVSMLRWANNEQKRKACSMWEMRKNNSYMYNMRERVPERWSGIRQACETWNKNWPILFKTMCKTSTQSRTYCKKMLELWEGFQAEVNKRVEEVLFFGMQKCLPVAVEAIGTKTMRAMWCGDGNKQLKKEILFQKMPEQSAFGKDEREGEFSFPVNNGKRRSFYKNEKANQRKRWELLRYLWWVKNTEGFVGSSYRLERGEQRSVKPDNFMRFLPHENTQKLREQRIIKCEKFAGYGSKEYPVYDIQVEGNHNFFANGILVHNCLLIDDPVDAKHAFSDVIRQSVNDTWDQALSSRLNDPVESGVLLIMQRLHEDDLSGHLQKKVRTKWTVLSIPMRYEGHKTFDAGKDIGRPELNDPREEVNELLFPARFTDESVQGLEEDLGEYGSAGQLQQKPVPSGGGIIKDYWWRLWPDDKQLPLFDHIFLSYDTAFSERDMKTSAFSAMTRWGIFWHEQRQRYCLMVLGRWFDRVGYDELRAMAKKWDKEYQPDAHLIEKKATGITLVQDLKRAIPTKVRTYTPGKGDDKISRAHSVSPMFQAGLIYIPDKHWAKNSEKTGLVDFVASFPNGSPPSADLTDTVTQACIYLRKMQWVSHPEDDEPDEPQEHVERRPAYG